MNSKATILSIALMFLAPAAAQAAIVDEGDTLLDTATGLRWVKPTTNRGRTVDSVHSEMTSVGEFAGCRWPVDDEVLVLFTNLGLPAPGDPIAGQDAEDLEAAIGLLGDTLDAYLDASNDPLDVSPTGAGWTKATHGSGNSTHFPGHHTLILRDRELVNRADGTPNSDSADVIDDAVRDAPWDGDGDAGVIMICPTWPTKPIQTQLVDFESLVVNATAPMTDDGWYIEGDATAIQSGDTDVRSSSCANCQNGGKWTTSITLSRVDGAPFGVTGIGTGIGGAGELGNCDDGESNDNNVYGGEHFRNECAVRGTTTWGEQVYRYWSPEEEFNEWSPGNGPWLSLQSLTVQATCGTGEGYEGYASCSDSYPARIILDDVQVTESIEVEIDYDPWSTANIIDPTNNAFITVLVNTTSIANGDPVDFNAADIDPDTLSLGIGLNNVAGAKISAAPISQDLDGDGDTDYIFGFRTQDTGFTCIDRALVLSGQTNDGKTIAGEAAVNAHDNCFKDVSSAVVDVEPYDSQNRVYPDDDYRMLVKLNDAPGFVPEAIQDRIRVGSKHAKPRDMIRDGSSNTDYEPIYPFEMQDTGITCDDTTVEVVGLYYTSQYVNGRWTTTPGFATGEPAFRSTVSIQTEDCDEGCHP